MAQRALTERAKWLSERLVRAHSWFTLTVHYHCILPLHTVTVHYHCTLSVYTVQCTVYTVHCTLYTVLCTLYCPRFHRMYPHT